MGVFNKKNLIMVLSGAFAASLSHAAQGIKLAASKVKAKAAPAIETRLPVHEWSAENIIKNFMFVGDFEQKEATRENSKEVFWRYPVTLPKVNFEIKINENLKSPDFLAAFPRTEGKGRAIQHLNRGRVYFLEGNFEEARKTWLSGRARFGSSYEAHRRLDYFIAQAFFYQAWTQLKAKANDFEAIEVRQNFVNATTFLGWAFDRKKDIYDPVLEQVAPLAYYNQAAIYYYYKRWAGVVGVVSNGLDYLRKTGRSEFRRELQLMKAELHIHGRDYLSAVQELDLSLRQDVDTQSGAGIMARVGDIYFDLNNFELAEEVYSAANRVDREFKQIRPSQYILRGESLFWLGKFEEARMTMAYALQAASLPQSLENLDVNMLALASLRIADSWLALGNFEKAKLFYFKHSEEFRDHETARFAHIRLACLELPEYDGNNILHARELLNQLKDQSDLIPAPAQELAWTCETASYAQHERTPLMVEKVRELANRYPYSTFLQNLADPVREVQARKIDKYFAAEDLNGAVQFFEKTRQILYPVVSANLAIKLFAAYADLNHAAKAKEFLPEFYKVKRNERGWLQLAATLVELAELATGREKEGLLKSSRDLAQEMASLDMKVDQNKINRMYLHRIISRPSGQDHFPWILSTGLKWLPTDISIACDIVYPMLEKMQANKQQKVEFPLEKSVEFFIDGSLKDLLRFETNCAYSLMEFELELHKAAISPLAKRYLQRDYIPFNSETAAIIWSVAEQCHAQGDKPMAESLWKMLSTKGGVELPEVRYARSRLNDQPTELEDLWRH